MKVDKQDAKSCWPWLGSVRNSKPGRDYGFIKYKSERVSAHRLAWELTFGEIPEGLLACHKCDNPRCCNPMHLFLGTYKDNYADMRVKGRAVDAGGAPRGERNCNARLTSDAVRQIRKLADDGLSQEGIAKQFGVDQTSVSKVIRKKTWSHVDA